MNKAQATFDQLNIVSGDMAASLAFYRRLGVAFPEEQVWRTSTVAHHASAAETEGAGGIGLDLDSMAFAGFWNSGWKGREKLAGRVVVGFRLATRAAVDEVYADLTAAGHKGLQEPWDAFWGARYAIVEDPDGIAVGLMSPISAKHRTPPPEV
jgi:uncharacterized glyoxalase superfamily protein PhnB